MKILLVLLFINALRVFGYLDKPGIVTYWGQNSRGGSNTQKSLSTYCDDSSDVIIISFVLNFRDGSLPTLNLANSCTGPTFPGTSLLKCSSIGDDIKKCQKKGKIILLSLGGDSGTYGFSNDNDAIDFADTMWNLFGGGKSKTRPFGDAIIDGFDLDIEGGGPNGYTAFVKRLRRYFSKDKKKKYYITAAPQCPYPDAMLGKTLNEAELDAVHVQFYNNYCSTTSGQFNFDTWNNWAKKTSKNKNVKIILGLPGSSKAAGSGYVPFKTLAPIIKKLYSTYSNTFGGVMIWDASASYGNTDISPNYQSALAKLVHSLSGIKTSTKKVNKTTKKHRSTTTRRSSTKKGNKGNQPKFCAKNGESCSSANQYVCSGDSFGVCNNGKWALFSCPFGYTCLSSTDGRSVYCGEGSNDGQCSSNKHKKREDNSITTHSTTINKSYQNKHVIAYFNLIEIRNHTQFSAVINARRLDQTAFKETVKVQFKIPPHITITNVNQGKIVQTDQQLVEIQYQNLANQSMNAVIQFEGKLEPGAVFTCPNMSSFQFI